MQRIVSSHQSRRPNSKYYQYLLAFLVQKVEQTGWLLREEIKALGVIDELDVLPLDALSHVLLLLELEDVLVEVVVQALVRVVDAELFEAVALKILEAKDVQHTDGITLKTKTDHTPNQTEQGTISSDNIHIGIYHWTWRGGSVVSSVP